MEIHILCREEYIDKDSRLIWKCPVHNSWETSYHNIKAGTGCPSCSRLQTRSKGEIMTENVLIKLGLDYECEKKFPDCRHIGQLSFDFYIPKLKLVVEYDGKQHFSPYFKNGIDAFQQSVTRDIIKVNYCHENNISLVRISYKCKTEDKIEEYTKGFLRETKNYSMVMIPHVDDKYKDDIDGYFGVGLYLHLIKKKFKLRV